MISELADTNAVTIRLAKTDLPAASSEQSATNPTPISAARIGLSMLVGAVCGTALFNGAAYLYYEDRLPGQQASAEIAAAKTVALATEMAITDNRDGLAPSSVPTLGTEDVDVLWYVADGNAYSLCVVADGKTASYDSKTGTAVSGGCSAEQVPSRP